MYYRTDTMPELGFVKCVPVHPDEKRPAYQIMLRDKAPVAAVKTVVAIITHDEILSRWHSPFTLNILSSGDDEQIMSPIAEFLLVQNCTHHIQPSIETEGLIGNLNAIDIQGFSAVDNMVTGETDDALYIIDTCRTPDFLQPARTTGRVLLTVPQRRSLRIVEYHHIAAMWLTNREYLVTNNRQPQSIIEFIDQNEIPHQQGRNHG